MGLLLPVSLNGCRMRLALSGLRASVSLAWLLAHLSLTAARDDARAGDVFCASYVKGFESLFRAGVFKLSI